MRILIVSNILPPKVLGGYEIACGNVARALAERGHEVFALTTAIELPHTDDPPWISRGLSLHWFHPTEVSDPSVKQWRLHQATCSDFSNTARLIAAVRSFRPDVCYVWNYMGIGGAGLLAALNAADVPWTIHLMDRIPEAIASNTAPHIVSVFGGTLHDLFAPATVIAMSEHLLNEIAESAGLRFTGDVELVPGWLDLPEPHTHLPYRRDGITRFVTAGALQPTKGIDMIVEAAGRLRREGLVFEVAVYGGGNAAPYVDLVNAHGATDVVRLCGARSQAELFGIYAESDAFLFPTWEREPFGFAPIEAAGCATPPIMTRNCGASERLVHGVHCIKIKRDVDALTDVMRDVASGHIDLARLGGTAARLVRQDLSFARWIERIEAVLARCASRPRNRSAVDDPRLEQLAYLQDMLALQMRFA
jgi:glycosyltransferase involved in cell wall biosynthesis